MSDALELVAVDAEIEPALLADLEALLARARSSLVLEGEHLDSVDERLADPSAHHLFAFVSGGRAVGLIDLALHHPDPDAATVAAIVIAPAHRRRGVGRALISRALAALDPADRPRSLEAGVHRDNAAALRFFEDLGWCVIHDDGGPVLILQRLD